MCMCVTLPGGIYGEISLSGYVVERARETSCGQKRRDMVVDAGEQRRGEERRGCLTGFTYFDATA